MDKSVGLWKGRILFSHRTSNSTGVLIAFREGLDVKTEATFTDNCGRLLILKAKIQDNPVILVNYHAPNEEGAQLRVLSEVNSILDKFVLESNSAFIWGGDFNLYFDIALETDGGNPKLKIKSLSKLLAMMQENDLCDIYRIRNQDEKRFTWQCRNPFCIGGLIIFFISDFLQDLFETTEILPSVQSDHSTLKLKFSPINEQGRGPSSWKFNNSLTTDKCIVDSMKSNIPTLYEESRELKDPAMRWEFLEYQIRQFTINYSREKASAWKAIPNFLFDEIGIKSVFHYNFKLSKNTSQNISLFPQFCQELVSFWKSVSKKQHSYISEIVGQCIWNNTYILKQGSTILYTRLYKSGIIIINDIIDTEGNLMEWISAKHKFELADQDMMRWLSIVQAIPSTWKKQISNYGKRINEKTFANIVIPNMKVKEVYAKLLRPLVQKPTPQKTIEKLLANDAINWQEVYMIPRKVSISSSLRISMYKILNNLLHLNRKISKFDQGVSHLCSLCLKKPEDILHLIVYQTKYG